ncbi:MAG: aminoglycoside phosphotransferase family protein [Planctomycetota bacterium]
MSNPNWLPLANTPEEFQAVVKQESLFSGAIPHILEIHQLQVNSISRYSKGSLVVYALGKDYAIKLYPPCFQQDYEKESLVLNYLQGRLSLPTPKIYYSGELECWKYLIMSQIQGSDWNFFWKDWGLSQKIAMSEQLGAEIASMHRLPIHSLGELKMDWNQFVKTQKENAKNRQRSLGLSEVWLEQIDPFLNQVNLKLDQKVPLVLLHTELMRDHVFAQKDEQSFRLSGLIDFEPSMLGAAEYEFSSVGLFISSGQAEVLRGFCRGYGYADHSLDESLQYRFLAYTLLHRYSHFPWYLSFMPTLPQQKLEILAKMWWAL